MFKLRASNLDLLLASLGHWPGRDTGGTFQQGMAFAGRNQALATSRFGCGVGVNGVGRLGYGG